MGPGSAKSFPGQQLVHAAPGQDTGDSATNWADFLERVEAVPSTQRERWIGELSRYAAEAGSASSVAQRLRASDDPRAWQMATAFESQTFDGR